MRTRWKPTVDRPRLVMNPVRMGASPVIASRLVSMVAPIMMKKIAEVADTVASADSATLYHGRSSLFSHRHSRTEQRAAAAPASVGGKEPENEPATRATGGGAEPAKQEREAGRVR